jgi:hypothetical protein
LQRIAACAGVAQLVEQLIRNQQVAGSSPATSSIVVRQPRPAGLRLPLFIALQRKIRTDFHLRNGSDFLFVIMLQKNNPRKSPK